MKFNNPVNDRAIWSIIKSELELDGKQAQEMTNRILSQLKRSCESALKMDRVELREELEAELDKKFKKRESDLLRREEAAGAMTREELVTILKENIDGDHGFNAQAAKLLTDLEGYKAATQDISVTTIDYAEAPDYYRTEMPDGV